MKRIPTQSAREQHNPGQSPTKRAKTTSITHLPPILYNVDERLQQQESINAKNRYFQKGIKLTLYPSLALFLKDFTTYQNKINEDLDPDFIRDDDYLIVNNQDVI